jgi:hypothetical protein
MNNDQKLKLIEALKAGKTLALESVKDQDDGGSCNLDSCHIFSLNFTEQELKEISRSSGVDLFKYDHEISISNPISGYQGFLRTSQAEAFDKILKSFGFKSYVHYVMD